MAAMTKKVLMISADNFEDTELLVPKYRLEEVGVQVDLAAPAKADITGKHGYTVTPNLSLDEISDAGGCGYSMLILPGGKAPAALRELPEAIDIVRDFQSAGLPIAAICHGPQLLVTAGGVQGKRMTCYASVAEELKAAGAHYEDAELVEDGQYITSRFPADLPAFDRAIVARLGV